ncbi:MAG: T9SS type A sorting domain-containing protein [Bacteroidetes bacterium]|nr:T9SS type A sorting domain-containing protein [Bacteroidota bacterium]
MRKIIYTAVLTVLLQLTYQSQTASSVSNGNWLNPSTWNCMCVPFGNYSVSINHNITLNTSLSFTSGGITINSPGSLIQDASNNRDIWINGAYMYNNGGNANFRYLLLSAGSASNSGSYTLSAITNSINFVNSGTIKMDSMYVAANFTNTSSGKIIGDSITTAAYFLNNGRMMINWSTNFGVFNNNGYYSGKSITNSTTFSNNDTLTMSQSIWNKGYFNNFPNSYLILSKNFNNHSLSNTARFWNAGKVYVNKSWYNTDSILGTATGIYRVQDTSANSGAMVGNFQFCDLTPPPTAPYIDYNSGYISSGITWCTATGIEENPFFLNELNVYSDLNSGSIHISGKTEAKILLYDQLGRQINEIELNNSNNYRAEIIGLEKGIYILTNNKYKKKLIVM